MDRTSAIVFAFFIAFYLGLCILSIVLICLVMCRNHLISYRYSNHFVRPIIFREPLRGLEVSVIESFPKFPYSTCAHMDTTDTDTGTKMRMVMTECVVCLGVFEENEMLRLLPKCGHLFHADCIDIWLHTSATCPSCRANLLAAEDPPQDMPTRAEVSIDMHHQMLAMGMVAMAAQSL